MERFRFALIGHNVTYSRSADIFERIFSLKNINGSCEIINIDPDGFVDRFRSITEEQVDGMSVTIPFKKAVMAYLDEIDPIAQAIEAVNSIRYTKGKKLGYNTDCFGFSKPLHPHANILKHGKALIFGAGGAAKAVVYTLYTDYEIKDFVILNRNMDKMRKFKESLSEKIDGMHMTLCKREDEGQIVNDRFDIAVNCTPLGGWNKPDLSPFPDSFDFNNLKIYYDLNYNTNNQLVKTAKTKTQVALDGSAMLVAQAIRSFYLWTGIQVNFDNVYSHVFGY